MQHKHPLQLTHACPPDSPNFMKSVSVLTDFIKLGESGALCIVGRAWVSCHWQLWRVALYPGYPCRRGDKPRNEATWRGYSSTPLCLRGCVHRWSLVSCILYIQCKIEMKGWESKLTFPAFAWLSLPHVKPSLVPYLPSVSGLFWKYMEYLCHYK